MRRIAAGALALAAFVLACGPARPANEIVFWQFWPEPVIAPILARFEQAHPGTKVRMEQLTWQSGQEKITAAVGADHVPDLCEVGSTWMPRLLEGGKLTDWTTEVAPMRAQLRGWELCSIGPSVHGVPWVLGTRALFWNKALFARAGLDSTRPPETWDELYRDAAAIQKLGEGVHGYGVQAGERYVLSKKFLPFAWGNGGRVLSDDLTHAAFDSPENVQALDFYLSLRKVGMVDHQDVLDREFKEGRLGLQISGAWLFKQIPRDAPGLRYGVALVPKPAADRGTHASWAGGEVLVSFTASAHKAAALELARFLALPENARALADSAQSVQPATVGADTAAEYRDRPGTQVFMRQFATAVFPPNHPAWGDMEAAIEDEVEQALLDRKSAARAVADAHKAIAELVGKP